MKSREHIWKVFCYYGPNNHDRMMVRWPSNYNVPGYKLEVLEEFCSWLNAQQTMYVVYGDKIINKTAIIFVEVDFH